jgi:putative oxidoreductase
MVLEMCKLWKCEKKCEWCFLVFRVFIGLLFAVHGAMKFGIIGEGTISGFATGVGIPLWLGVIVGLIELVGGLAIAFGILTRLFAAFAGIELIVAYIMAHLPNGWNPFTNGGELALVYLASFILLFGYGAGKFSLDSLLCKKCK